MNQIQPSEQKSAAMKNLEKAIMLQVNERLFQKDYISKTQYEYAKIEIVKM